MPNTLAHLGIQTLATRSLIRSADLKWIGLGCVIPDIPWILQRVIGFLGAGLSPYDLRLYAIVQSSLLFSLILGAACAMLSDRPRVVFTILSLNSLMHLLLDALQTKWGNGVHLFAPFSWDLLNFGLFWPESLPTILLTIGGLLCVVIFWLMNPGSPVDLSFGNRRSIVVCSALFLAYFAAPVTMLAGPEAADNHFVRTLRVTDQRLGRAVQFDRATFIDHGQSKRVRTLAGEELDVTGALPEAAVAVSAKGRFTDRSTVEFSEVRVHRPMARDFASVAGLLLVACMWVKPLRKLRSRAT